MKSFGPKEAQFVTDASGHRVAVLMNLKTYERLREAEDDLRDIRAYDAARPKVMAELAAGHSLTLAAYRSKRAMRG